MRVIVCGGRHYNDRKFLFEFMDQLFAKHQDEPFTLIQGGATGADSLAWDWAVKVSKTHQVSIINLPADWEQYGKAAGPIRNKKMLTYNPDLVVAFDGGKGTANMLRQARAAGVPVLLAKSA